MRKDVTPVTVAVQKVMVCGRISTSSTEHDMWILSGYESSQRAMSAAADFVHILDSSKTFLNISAA
eukprot:1086418-Rhodomonas_salina.1